jgi:ubiquinone/menaquinone biosynthesis C-methylase UbiE
MLDFIKSKLISVANLITQTKNIAIEDISVDQYWSHHTVNSIPFESAKQSLEYLEWRFQQYPQFKELMELYGDHKNQVILDYGCGPGNDLVGFLTGTSASKVIGVDISSKALNLAQDRLKLHEIDPQRFQLIQTSDSSPKISLADHSVDYIYCEGVLHHTSYPQEILKEFFRILKPNTTAMIMVYNRDSLWFHLYTAYIKRILENTFLNMDIETAFSKNTDGENCPVARCYKSSDFIALCEASGFQTDYVGGYLSLHELNCLEKYKETAIADSRLEEEHRNFLLNLKLNDLGYPVYDGKYAGIGGVYKLFKA